jgi:hypothetical protein
MLKHTYWNNQGTFQTAGDELNKLIPVEGSVAHPRKNRKLEKFRNACNAYHDLYNNGLGNRAHDFRLVFGIASSQYKGRRPMSFNPSLYRMTEEVMDLIVIAAAQEQGIAVVVVNPRDKEVLA